jgi:hypothetical protein
MSQCRLIEAPHPDQPVLDRRCPAAALPGGTLGLCATHYAKAVAEYCRLTGGKLALTSIRKDPR